MPAYRVHGVPPYTVAVLHGGPGACGEMATVARELAARGHGVLEPLEAAYTIGGQVEELRETLAATGTPPYTLIGHSWGAWLGCLTATRHPSLVRKLILVGSAPFEARYVAGMDRVRLDRLDVGDRAEAESLMTVMQQTGGKPDDSLFARFGALMDIADTGDPFPGEIIEDTETAFNPRIYRHVWPEAAALRATGSLLAAMTGIKCPVVAIHGDYDSHPAAGVRDPLTAVLRDFRFILLPRCGHTPWNERHGRDAFYRILDSELA